MGAVDVGFEALKINPKLISPKTDFNMLSV